MSGSAFKADQPDSPSAYMVEAVLKGICCLSARAQVGEYLLGSHKQRRGRPSEREIQEIRRTHFGRGGDEAPDLVSVGGERAPFRRELMSSAQTTSCNLAARSSGDG